MLTKLSTDIITSFTSNKSKVNESIFNKETKFEDMLCAYYVFNIINYSKNILSSLSVPFNFSRCILRGVSP